MERNRKLIAEKGSEKRNISPGSFPSFCMGDLIYPPLIQALYCERPLEMFVALFKSGANPRLTDRNGYNTLHHATKQTIIKAVKLMLKSEYKEELLREPKEPRLETIMTRAVQCSLPVEMCSALVEAGADPTVRRFTQRNMGLRGKGHYGANVLTMAFTMLYRGSTPTPEPFNWIKSATDFFALIQCLIDKHPALLKELDDNLDTPLISAARYASVELVGTLLNAGSDPYYISPMDKRNVLHIAVERGYEKLVQRLLILPYRDINARDSKGNTPLMLTKDKAIRDLLTAAGAQEGEEASSTVT